MLVGVKKLVLEAEALDFVEVYRAVFGINLIYCNASYGLVRAIVDFVKGKSSFTRIDDQRVRFRLELPRNLIFSVSHEANLVFPEDTYFVISKPVVFRVLPKGEAECLADYIVEGYRQEVASKE